MPNCLFQFKQFETWSHIGGFKVGTDAVLLGAWVNVDEDETILEVGSGTGVVSLMAAQRTSGYIDAVEIDEAAANQTKFNFERSRFGNLNLTHTSIQKFAKDHLRYYDHVICNPPYFQFSSKPESETLHKAKHTDSLEPIELLTCAGKLLKPKGKLSVIIPISNLEQWESVAQSQDLIPSRKLYVRPVPEYELKRVLVEWGKGSSGECETSELTLEQGETENREYTLAFRHLLKDYFIKF